ncbi:unnamed protein product [Auanema sp. JU1783]|nr:unnamed protein product [Auanema sp. JU1783]
MRELHINVLSNLLLLLASNSFSLAAQAKMPQVKLIIDTDGVSDDIRAISLAMQHPDVEVVAFTTVHGCTTVEQATANVARAQRANNVKTPIPIYKGAETPFIRKAEAVESEHIFFGKDGIGDQPEAFPKVVPSDFHAECSEIAAMALIRLTREDPNITVVSIGPLTNVALALKLDPNFARQPQRLVIMGGNYYGIGNVDSSSSAEFNFHGDPEAAAIVLKEMECAITVVPWESFFLEGPHHEKEVDFNKHLNYSTPLASFLSTATSIGREMMARNGRQYSYCDEIAVATAIHPELIVRKYASLRVNVELAGKHTRGQVVVDWVDVLWNNEDAEFTAAQGKTIDRTNRTIDFVTSYNVTVVDKWMHNACKGNWNS